MKSLKHIERTLVFQQGQSDCGVACLVSILRYYGGNSPLERLRELSGTDPQGTTLLGLYQAASQIGFDAEGMEAERIENLKTDVTGPVILHLLLEDRLLHYVVCYGWNEQKCHFLIGDPARGLTTYTEAELSDRWSSRVLLALTPNDKLELQADEQRAKRRWLWEVVREDAPLLGIATGLGVVTAALGLSTAIFSQKLIDEILPKADTRRLVFGLILLAVLLMARSLVAFLRGILLNQQSRLFNNRIINRFYESLLYLPKSFFDSRKTGELIARMNDTARIQRTISHLSGAVIINGLVVLVSSVYIFTYSVPIGLLTLVSIPLYGGLAWYFHRPILNGQRNMMAASAQTESNYVDAIQGIDVIKATHTEPFFARINRTVYGLFQEKVYQLTQTGLRFGLVAELMGAVLVAGIIAYASFLVLQKQLQVGEMMALLTMAGSIIPAVSNLTMTNMQLQEAKVAFDRMYEFTQLEPEYQITGLPPESSLPTDAEKVPFELLKLEKVSFRFPGRPVLLNEVTLTVRRGELVALVGESGKGKSTLMQLIQRFYQPESGQIKVNNINWADIYTTDWRSMIGVVPQHIKVFSGTLLDNIGLGNTADEAQRIVNFCREYGFHRYFEQFPQGYLTLLGEDGVKLSGGQRQLVALARALYRKPQLLLLDEPTASMDRHTADFVIQLIQQLREQMGILWITHQHHIASEATRIYTLEDNKVRLLTEQLDFSH
ncbi:peptidase domain-containing ABC transporter [Larkinella sp.]|uniref:peptidase domain-containing ABC transporter n=1 Tax=Larkinella sp. TaxID=2034517 RepID=UPI003BA9315B